MPGEGDKSVLEPGNIDLDHRPIVKNKDGSISTVRSMSFNEDGKEILVPTVSPEGHLLSDEDAIGLYHKTGQHLGKFASEDAATQYALKLHESQEKLYQGKPPTAYAEGADTRRVDAYNPDGKLVSIPASQAVEAQQKGYSLLTSAQMRQRNEDKSTYELAREKGLSPISSGLLELTNPGGLQGEAFRQGLMRGATGGLGQLAQQKLSGLIGPALGVKGEEAEKRYAQGVQGLEQQFPVTSGVGEAGGMVAGSLIGSEALEGLGVSSKAAGLIAKALPTQAIEGLGAAAEGLAGRATAGVAARGAMGRAAGAAARYGARAAAETGAYEAIKETSEEALGDTGLNGEKIWAAAQAGAEGGLLFGGVLGAGGSLARSGALGAENFAQDVLSKNAEKLQGMADEQRWRALNPLKKYSEQAERRIDGGTKAVGEVLGKYGITGESIAQAAKEGGIDAIGPKVDEAVDKVGARIGELQSGSPGTVSWKSIDSAFEDALGDMRHKAGHESIVKSLDAYRNSLEEKLAPGKGIFGNEGDIPLQDALFQRKALDQLVYKESKALDPNMRVETLRKFRTKFEDVIMKGFDEAADATGDAATKGELRSLKKDYQALSLAQDAAEATTSRMATNRNLSMSDYLASGILSHTLGLPGAVLGGAINRIGRERGNAIAASLLDKASELGGRARSMLDLPELSGETKKGLYETVDHAHDAAQGIVNDRVEPPPPVQKPRPELIFNEPKPTMNHGPMPDAEATMPAFESRINDAINHLDKHGKHGGLVPIKYIRAEFPELSREEFDRKMLQSDASRTIKLSVLDDMRHASEEQKANSILSTESRGLGDRATVNYGYASSFEPPSGKTWERSHIGPKGTDEWLANEESNVLKHIEDVRAWKFRKSSAEAEHRSALIDWESQHAAALNEHERIITQMRQEFADQSATLQKAAEFARAKDAIQKVDGATDAAAKGIIDGPSESQRKLSYRQNAEPLARRFQAAKDDIQAMQQALPQSTARAAAQIQSMPKISQALGQAAMRTGAYLASKVPAPAGQPTLGQPMPSRVSDADMHAFMDRYDAAKNPVRAMHVMASGKVTVGAAEALRVVSPKMFAELQQKAFNVVNKRQADGDPLPFDARQRMHILLGIVTDPSQDPKMMAALQSNLADAGQQQGPKGPPPAKAPKPSGPKTKFPTTNSRLDSLEES